jgi:hypothetical protein
MHFPSEWNRHCPTRYRSLYIILGHGADPIRPDTEACTSFPGVDPILSDPIPKLAHHVTGWIRTYPIIYRSLYPFFRNGSDPIRSDTGVCNSSTGMEPTISDPIPELVHDRTMRNRSHTIRYQSLCISLRNGPDPIRPDTEAYTPSPGMDSILSDPIQSVCFCLPGWIRSDPIRSHPIPGLIPILPGCIRPDPIRYRSLYIIFRSGPDLIRPDTRAYTLSSDGGQILSDMIAELVHHMMGCIRSEPVRYRSLYVLSRDGSDPIRSDTGVHTFIIPAALILSEQTTELIHPFLEWIRSGTKDLTLVRNGSDPIRSDTEACTSPPGMDPNLSDPIPKLIPLLPEWIRPDSI